MHKTIASVLIFLACVASRSVFSDSGEATEKECDEAVQKVYSLISSYLGDREPLEQAKVLLDELVLKNPQNASVHTAMARYYLTDGMISGAHNYQPGTYAKVDQALKLAIDADPKYAFAYVVQGEYWFAHPPSKFTLHNAFSSYRRAIDLGYDYRKAQLPIIRIYMEGDHWSHAEKALQDFESYAATTKLDDATIASLTNVQKIYYTHLQDYARVDQAFLKLIEMDPTNAWRHGNYASFLIFTLGRTDEAIREGKMALQLMDYGMAHAVLAVSQLAKWAELRKTDPIEAQAFFDASLLHSTDMNWIAVRAFSAAGINKAMQNLSEALLEHQVPIGIKNENGDSAISIASDAATVAWLLKHGADPNGLDHKQRPPIYQAARSNRADVIRILVNHGVNVNQTREKMNSLLFSAVFHGADAAVEALLEAGANPDFTSQDTCITPLMEAARQGKEQMARALVKRGAKVDAICTNQSLPNEPKNAVEYADRNHHQSLGDFLRGQASQQHSYGQTLKQP